MVPLWVIHKSQASETDSFEMPPSVQDRNFLLVISFSGGLFYEKRPCRGKRNRRNLFTGFHGKTADGVRLDPAGLLTGKFSHLAHSKLVFLACIPVRGELNPVGPRFSVFFARSVFSDFLPQTNVAMRAVRQRTPPPKSNISRRTVNFLH